MTTICTHLTNNIPGCIGASPNQGGTYRLDFVGSSRSATASEITAAQAVLDAETADLATYRTERADLQSQLQTAANRLTQIKDATSMNNTQLFNAVKDMAQIQLRMLKYIRRL